MPRPNVTGASTLLKEFLNHRQGNSESSRDFFPSALLAIVRRQNPFP